MKAFEYISNNPLFGLIAQGVVWTAFYLTPIKTAMWTIIILIASDMFFGIWASVFKKKEPFSSRAIRRTIRKIFIYEFSVVLALILQKNVWPKEQLVSGCLSFISIIESISILEHLKTLTGIDFWAYFFDRFGKNTSSGKFLFKLKPKPKKRKRKKS